MHKTSSQGKKAILRVFSSIVFLNGSLQMAAWEENLEFQNTVLVSKKLFAKEIDCRKQSRAEDFKIALKFETLLLLFVCLFKCREQCSLFPVRVKDFSMDTAT